MRCMTSDGICRGFAFKYGKFPLPLRYRTALSVPKVPTMYSNATDSCNRIERLIWLNNGKTLDTIVIKHKLYAKKDLQQFLG